MPELTKGFKTWLIEKEGTESLAHKLYDKAIAVVSSQAGYPNIELVLQLLADLESFKAPHTSETVESWRPPFDADAKTVSALAATIRDYIRTTLSAVPAALGEYMSGLMDFPGKGEPLDVFTLNYDRLVESMAAQLGYRFTTGFGEAWDPSLFELNTWDLRLYKIHGSVDWYRLASKNVIYRGSPDHPAFPGERAQEVLLYPARGKAAHADPFATLMSLFNRALTTADLCIAIGYSFRDAHIRRAILDRMITNRKLQLLIVNPGADAVMSLHSDDPDEPQFSQFRDRISGLSKGTRDALENRAIVTRISEILNIDVQLGNARQFRNQGNFWGAARDTYDTIESCRRTQLPYKPVAFLSSQRGTEFDLAFSNVLSQHFQALSGLRAQSQFDTTSSQVVATTVSNYVALWALASARSLPIAENVRGELTTILTQLASNVLFLANGEYAVWRGAFNLEDKKTIEKRALDLAELVIELKIHPPLTALTVANHLVRNDYEALKALVTVLSEYYRFLSQFTTTRRQIHGHPTIGPDDLRVFGKLSAAVGMVVNPTGWLPTPHYRGPQSELPKNPSLYNDKVVP